MILIMQSHFNLFNFVYLSLHFTQGYSIMISKMSLVIIGILFFLNKYIHSQFKEVKCSVICIALALCIDFACLYYEHFKIISNLI